VNYGPTAAEKAHLIGPADVRALTILTALSACYLVVEWPPLHRWLFETAMRRYRMLTYAVVGLLGTGFFILALNWLERDYSTQAITKLEGDLREEQAKVTSKDQTLRAKDAEHKNLQDAIEQLRQRERELQGKLDSKIATKELLARLGEFKTTGDGLYGRCIRERGSPEVEKAANEWYSAALRYLESVEPSYAVRFKNIADITIITAPHNYPMDKTALLNSIKARLMRLNEFMSDLQRRS
jgi:hypothetical protein